jgi:catechol 2,3-dioxygenase-like lactoylglutathione lyase family enzyme
LELPENKAKGLTVSATSTPVGQFGNVIVPVTDMDQACAFYQDVLGLGLKFRDDDRWAAFGTGPVTLALAGRDSGSAPDQITIGIKVEDVQEAVDRAVRGGARLERGPSQGVHEISATIVGPSGHLVTFYKSLEP